MSTYIIEIIVLNDIGRSQGESNLSNPDSRGRDEGTRRRSPVTRRRSPVARRPSPERNGWTHHLPCWRSSF